MKESAEFEGRSLRWLSPIELLVIVVIIGILISMLLPAVQRVRSVAKRTQSQNNLRQIALGALNFQSANMRFPASNNRIKSGSEEFGWGVAVIPFMEASNLYSRVDENQSWDSIGNSFVDSRDVIFYTSPFELHHSYNHDGFGVLHYAACSELFSGDTGVLPGEDFEWDQFMFGEICDGYEPWAKPGSCRQFSNGIGFDMNSFGNPVFQGAVMARANGGVEFVSSSSPRPVQVFEGKRTQVANGMPDRYGYEIAFGYSPVVEGWRGNSWFQPGSKGYGGGQALDDQGLRRITRDGNLVSLILGGAHDVTGDGLKSLAGSSVTRLSIDLRNGIRDEDLKVLHNMSTLKRIGLADGEFSNESIENLRQALPNCEVVVE